MNQDKEKAIKSIAFWKGAMIKAFFEADIHDPRQIQENGRVVGDDTIHKWHLSYQMQKKA